MTKKLFPIFDVNPGLVYFESAATTQLPQVVLDKVTKYESSERAPVDGLAVGSIKVNQTIDHSRQIICDFVGATRKNQIVFTAGATDSINMVAWGLRARLHTDDIILVSALEHHANLIPWQEVASQTGAKLEIIPILSMDVGYDLDWDWLSALDWSRVKIISVTHLSNTLGNIIDIKRLSKLVKHKNANTLICVDGAQFIGHHPLDVIDLDIDFYVFSAHKMYGPTGIGVLYGKDLSLLHPYRTGGKMIESVTYQSTYFLKGPQGLEAGTPNTGGIIGLAAAAEFITAHRELIASESVLTKNLYAKLLLIPEIELVSAVTCTGIVSFVFKNIETLDAALYLARQNISIRAGHHCTQPLIDMLGYDSTIRVSIGIYNDESDIELLLEAITKTINFYNPA